MDYFVMKQHAIATYLQLIEGYNYVLYDVGWLGVSELPIDLIGMNEKGQALIIDIAEKFKRYPKDIRPNTLKRKLIRRYTFAKERVNLLGMKEVEAQVWFLGTPPEKLEIVLPSVIQILKNEQNLILEVVPSTDASKRILKASVSAQQKYVENPFAQALMLATGVLEAPPRKTVLLPKKFPLELPDPYSISTFIGSFLSSKYIVGWLGFDALNIEELLNLACTQKGLPWSELRPYIDETISDFSSDWEEEEYLSLYSAKYTYQQIEEIMRWLIRNAKRVWDIQHKRRNTPIVIEIGFLLPFLSKNRYLIPELVEAEIVRYGGDRDLVKTHFQIDRPDKRPYRGYIRLVLQGADDPPPPATDLFEMEVQLGNHFLRGGIFVSLSLLYPTEFAGYFLLTFDAIAKDLLSSVERFNKG